LALNGFINQSSSQTRTDPKLEQLGQQYSKVRETSAGLLEWSKNAVAEHQEFQDQHDACAVKLVAIRNDVSEVMEMGSGADKFALQTKLDSVEVCLMKSRRDFYI